MPSLQSTDGSGVCLPGQGLIRVHDFRHLAEMGKAEMEAYLMWLVAPRNVSSSTHRQALSALLFLYGKVREVKRLPVTLSLDYRSCSGMLM